MNHLKKTYQRNRVFIWAIGIALCAQLVYISQATSNAPLMDYWRYMDRFVEKMFSGGLSWSDFWRSDGIHRSPLQFLYFVCNIRFFHYDAQIEIYLGAVLMAVLACVLYRFLKLDLQPSHRVSAGAGVAVIIVIYNLNQWELIAEQFSLSFASRLFLFLLGYLLTNRYLYTIEQAKKYTGELGALYIITIALVGGGYFPAYVFSILTGIVVFALINYRKNGRKYWKYYVTLILFLIVGTIIYLFGVEYSGTGSSVDLKQFVYYLVVGSIVMLGVCLLGTSATTSAAFATGLFITAIALVLLVLYFKHKCYEKTSMPVFFYAYTAGSLGIICLGRGSLYGFGYCFYSRYTCESNVLLLGVVWIAAMLLSEKVCRKDESKKHSLGMRVGVLISTGVILCGIVCADIVEWKQAPYRKDYYDNLIQCMLDVDTLSAEDFSVFQAKEEYVRQGIALMKKYDLGIYRYEE